MTTALSIMSENPDKINFLAIFTDYKFDTQLHFVNHCLEIQTAKVRTDKVEAGRAGIVRTGSFHREAPEAASGY